MRIILAVRDDRIIVSYAGENVTPQVRKYRSFFLVQNARNTELLFESLVDVLDILGHTARIVDAQELQTLLPEFGIDPHSIISALLVVSEESLDIPTMDFGKPSPDDTWPIVEESED